MNYDEAVGYLNSLSRFGWRLGLDRIEALCERLDHPERAFKSIHVAGTNGKGSTSTYLAAILQAAGFRTGLYTSPHIISGRERIRVDGENISETEVAELVSMVRPHLDVIQERMGPVTEFEAWTAVMFLHFRWRGVHYAVIETGLGGRWDATNVVRPVLSVLTNVSLDHTDRLGNTIAEIARDKAGIIKPGCSALVGSLPEEAYREASKEAKLVSAPLYALVSPEDAARRREPRPAAEYFWEDCNDSSFVLTCPDGSRSSLLYTGAHYQVRNAALAAAAADLLRESLDSSIIEKGLKTSVPGRFEIVCREPEIILDGAHNPAAAAVLAAELARGRVSTPSQAPPHLPDLRLVFGGSSGHDVAGCLRILAPLCREVILTRAHNPRSVAPEELAPELDAIDVPYSIIPEVASAVGTAVSRSRSYDRVCVCGSFFVLGETPRNFTSASALRGES